MPQAILPLCEGMCPPCVDEDGNAFYPEPSNEPDPEIMETEKYAIEDKDEFYDYVTKCKSCGVEFIALIEKHILVRNFCPNCGKALQ